MFIVKPECPEGFELACFILSYYHVNTEFISDGENPSSTTFMVSADGNDERLAEMAFQSSFYQEGNVCCKCEDEGEAICGHLTFTTII